VSGARSESGRLLIAEDEAPVARSLERFFRRHQPTALATTAEDALSLVRSGASLSGAVVDIGLPDGSGLEVVRELRRRPEAIPVLVLTGKLDRALVNEAQSLGAEYAVKPVQPENLEAFARRVAAMSGHAAAVGAAVAVFSQRYALSVGESRLLAAAARGTPRSLLAVELGVSINTVKTQIRSILDKYGSADDLSAIVHEVWRHVSGNTRTSG
jgi:DNA-binding NarL/FixJ family response regulator